MQNALELVAGPQPLTPAQAQARRAEAISAAARLDMLWGEQPWLPAFTWETLSTLPRWAFADSRQLKRLALVTGALFAAPGLRVCLDASPLLRMRKLIGGPALDMVLATPDLPHEGPAWKIDANTRGAEIYARSASLLLASARDPLVRASLACFLGLSHDPSGPTLVDADLAERMVDRAVEIVFPACVATEIANTDGEAM